jgi:hypothetical protein
MFNGGDMSQRSKSARPTRLKSRFTKISADGKKLKANAKTWVAVLDNLTGLMWDVGETVAMNWADAKAHCKKLRTAGLKGWQLPTVKQWETIIDRLRANPCVDTTNFPNCKPGWHWADDVDITFPSAYAWLVSLHSGYVYRSYQTYHSFVRAVRAGQPSDFGIRAKKAKVNRKVAR